MAFLAPIAAAMGTMMASAGTAVSGAMAGLGTALTGGAAAGTAAGAGTAAATAGTAAAGTAAAGAGAAATGLTIGEMAALGLTAAGVGSTLLAPTPEMPDMPTVATPDVMPTEDSEATLKARQRAMVSQQQRQGRASTMLSNSNAGDRLGG